MWSSVVASWAIVACLWLVCTVIYEQKKRVSRLTKLGWLLRVTAALLWPVIVAVMAVLLVTILIFQGIGELQYRYQGWRLYHQ